MRTTEIMLPIHVAVPRDIREQILEAASSEGVSMGVIVRELLCAGIKVKGLSE